MSDDSDDIVIVDNSDTESTVTEDSEGVVILEANPKVKKPEKQRSLGRPVPSMKILEFLGEASSRLNYQAEFLDSNKVHKQAIPPSHAPLYELELGEGFKIELRDLELWHRVRHNLRILACRFQTRLNKHFVPLGYQKFMLSVTSKSTPTGGIVTVKRVG